MREWKSRISGKQLRDEIKNGSPFRVLETLKMELKFKLNHIKDEDEKCEFEDLYYLVESDVSIGEEELLRFVKEEDWSINELVDDRLCQFYDLCDKYDIWVTI